MESQTSPDTALKNGLKPSFAAWLSIAINLLLFILKYWAGIVTNSVAILADAWHTLSDSASSVIVLIGLKISSKPADKEHPFGHGRAELIASIIIGVILGVIGFNFLIESFQRIKQHQVIEYGLLAKIAVIVSIALKEVMAQYSFWSGKKYNSESLIADGWHHRSDALSSIIIIIGIFFGGQLWWIDGVMGLIVSGMIFYATYQILSKASDTLLGEKPDQKTLKRITAISKEIASREIYLHHTHIHTYGDHKELTFHIRLPSDMPLDQAHDIATRIEKRINEELNMEVTIHMEPLYEEHEDLN